MIGPGFEPRADFVHPDMEAELDRPGSGISLERAGLKTIRVGTYVCGDVSFGKRNS